MQNWDDCLVRRRAVRHGCDSVGSAVWCSTRSVNRLGASVVKNSSHRDVLLKLDNLIRRGLFEGSYCSKNLCNIELDFELNIIL